MLPPTREPHERPRRSGVTRVDPDDTWLEEKLRSALALDEEDRVPLQAAGFVASVLDRIRAEGLARSQTPVRASSPGQGPQAPLGLPWAAMLVAMVLLMWGFGQVFQSLDRLAGLLPSPTWLAFGAASWLLHPLLQQVAALALPASPPLLVLAFGLPLAVATAGPLVRCRAGSPLTGHR